MRLPALALGLFLTATAANAWAHGGHAHHGAPTEGTITAAKGEHLTLRTDTGSVAVTLTKATHIASGEKELGWKALQSKTRVSVFGTTLESGELVAEDIHVEGGDTPAHTAHQKH